jgi:hypothetical protein
MNRAMTVAAMGGLGLALVSASGVLLAPLGYRLGVWDVRFALLTLVKWATIASLAAFVVCLLAAVGGWVRHQRAGRGYAYVGLLLSVICAGVPLSHYAQARRVPPIHDITTDTAQPPTFVALAAARAAAPNGLAYAGAAVAAAQQQAYPDLVPYLSPLSSTTLCAQAAAVARTMGWELVAVEPQQGRLEATDTSLFFGFTGRYRHPDHPARAWEPAGHPLHVAGRSQRYGRECPTHSPLPHAAQGGHRTEREARSRLDVRLHGMRDSTCFLSHRPPGSLPFDLWVAMVGPGHREEQ